MLHWSTTLLSGSQNRSSIPFAAAILPLYNVSFTASTPESQTLDVRPDTLSASKLPSTRRSSSTMSPAPRPTQHGRLISHPFPSLLNGRETLGRTFECSTPELDMDASIDSNLRSSHRPINSIPPAFGHRGGAQPIEQESIVGRCATCNSSVRWPKNLDVYRCSICLMINDLETFVNGTPAMHKTEICNNMRLSRKGT